MIDWESYRADRPHIQQGIVWLQHAGITPICGRVMNVAQSAMAQFATQPAASYRNLWYNATDGARKAVAGFLGAETESIALVKNTSQGVIFIAESLPYEAGDTIVTLAGEYPVNRLPWRSAARHGATVRVVEPDAEGRFPIDRLAAAIDSSTKVVAVSWVQYLNGFTIDLPALAEVCRRHDAWLVVDGVQGVGALPVPLECCDAIAVGGHKWICGSEGAGFLYIAPRLLSRLEPFNVSWHSVAEDLSVPGAEIATESGVPALKPTAERFEEGTPNAFGNLMLAEACRMLGEIGAANIAARHRELQDRLAEDLRGKGYRITSSLRDGERSGILSFDREGHDPDDLVSALKRDQIICLRRGDSVRLSPHFYNNGEDVGGRGGQRPASQPTSPLGRGRRAQRAG